MSVKLLSYNEISNNDKVVVFEIEIIEEKIFSKNVLKAVKGYKNHKFDLCYYLESGDIIHYIGSSIKAIIDSGAKQFRCEN